MRSPLFVLTLNETDLAAFTTDINLWRIQGAQSAPLRVSILNRTSLLILSNLCVISNVYPSWFFWHIFTVNVSLFHGWLYSIKNTDLKIILVLEHFFLVWNTKISHVIQKPIQIGPWGPELIWHLWQISWPMNTANTIRTLWHVSQSIQCMWIQKCKM